MKLAITNRFPIQGGTTVDNNSYYTNTISGEREKMKRERMERENEERENGERK